MRIALRCFEVLMPEGFFHGQEICSAHSEPRCHGVAQIVEMKVREAGLLQGGVPSRIGIFAEVGTRFRVVKGPQSIEPTLVCSSRISANTATASPLSSTNRGPSAV